MVTPQGSVTSLKTITQACNEDVIARLERVLERARAGEIVAVGIAIVANNGAIGRTWSRCDPAGPLIGACALLQHDLISSPD
jgi:hypothetical protein